MNYIVSGLERSGTSLMMAILEAGGFPVAYDESRKPDESNPKGYYELFGGKIINRLMENEVYMHLYDESAIKITSVGLTFLPREYDYRIIYMERDIKEVKMSMQKMAKEKLADNLEELLHTENVFLKDYMDESGYEYIVVNYNSLLTNPGKEIKRVSDFCGGIDIEKAETVIDRKLYRNRKEEK